MNNKYVLFIIDKLALEKLPRNAKRLLMLITDLIIMPLALWSAFSLRLGTVTPDVSHFWWMFPLAPLLSIPLFIKLGLYHAIVRFMGTHAMYAVLKGVTLSTLLLATIVLLSGVKGVPRSVFLIYWGVAVLYIGGSRFLMRSYFYALTRPKKTHNIYAIYGAGSSGIQLSNALRHSHEAIPVAFFDDDKSLHGSVIHGIKVYAPQVLPKLIEEYGISQILLAMPSVSRVRRRAIVEELEPLPVYVRTIPALVDLVSGNAKVNELHEVDIEDLLGRDPVEPNEELLNQSIRNKNVLVTGAGGSIGSELCRQIYRLQPKQLILLEISEYALYAIERELKNTKENEYKDIDVVPLLGNVQNIKDLQYILQLYNVDTIYHAAAYKHVPLVEHNIIEGINNNIYGTLNTALAALDAGVETFVLISTDKAVRPTNIMGASKRFAEIILQALASYKKTANLSNDLINSTAINKLTDKPKNTKTQFCMVRFGNVLGSSGSVVPLFREQIHNGGPVTVTHPDIIRYFMTIPEAAQLVLQAGALGDNGDVFVLDMGEPVKIYELAKRMIHLSGLTVKDEYNPDGDIEIQVTGLRPGEKLYEELLIGDNVTGTQHPRIMRAEETYITYDKLKDILSELQQVINLHDVEGTINVLTANISGYTPESEIKDYLWSIRKTISSNPKYKKVNNIINLSNNSDEIEQEKNK